MSATLAARQQALLAALWQPRHAGAIESIAAQLAQERTGGHKHSERGLLAYRSNHAELAHRALAAAFPVVAQLLGDDNFHALARQLWARHPPQRGDLAQWGGALPGLVESLPHLAQEEPYLADVARVEWALHAAATAADAAVDMASFGVLSTHDPERITLTLCPGAHCIASAYPVVSIVQAHQCGDPTLEQAGHRLRGGVAESALVWRRGLAPSLRMAAPDEAPFIAALQGMHSLADSLATARGLDFNAWLAPAVQAGLLTGARPL